MRKALLLVVIFGSLFLITGETLAQCSCSPEYRDITAQKEFGFAYAVFVGQVVAVSNSARDEKDHYTQTVSFHVTKAWKHDLSADLTITNHIQGCLHGFERKEEWLVYAYKNADGTLAAYCCCTRTTRLANANEDLKTFASYQQTKILTPEARKP